MGSMETTLEWREARYEALDVRVTLILVGLGGWQDRAMLIWPSDLPRPPERLIGADAVHRQLVSWLEHLGHRADLPPARPRAYDTKLSV